MKYHLLEKERRSQKGVASPDVGSRPAFRYMHPGIDSTAVATTRIRLGRDVVYTSVPEAAGDSRRIHRSSTQMFGVA